VNPCIIKCGSSSKNFLILYYLLFLFSSKFTTKNLRLNESYCAQMIFVAVCKVFHYRVFHLQLMSQRLCIILVASSMLGFGPFASHKVNASWVAVQELSQSGGLGDDINLITIEIPVTYEDVSCRVPDIWKTYQPKVVSTSTLLSACISFIRSTDTVLCTQGWLKLKPHYTDKRTLPTRLVRCVLDNGLSPFVVSVCHAHLPCIVA